MPFAVQSGRPLADTPPVAWRKSSYSSYNGNCVEIADLPGGEVGVRDSKNPALGALKFTPAEWGAFTGAVRSGEFDR
jgi:hypothetical protein